MCRKEKSKSSVLEAVPVEKEARKVNYSSQKLAAELEENSPASRKWIEITPNYYR